ncbi:phosphoribosyl-AMP cyclohydrolase [Candidatus Aquiluna sp. UB-MaderosW2red]|jgi:phosphoribosyl-ATP pyrophosphohydrolase/phosphoribosyl-AMP cyclohydrolase|uniref:phosphoribosyl-AMP cyclohydrolase n=1 Tax=Candidatus Aquiluna sp. UB-MaderosW2red TaxID=1855377 RepID=UPI000875DFF4|nr:phosphoribosyl-AMP cyclohydrolase [Candidatus Aquiluna sp. UB-MaderosW2red]SCX11763.1 phosphoribosyl-ATP pyrophosphohydrolase / phosphoribosyl-AMP cyclohydrolase [Candidatus Aquiluna sp. UB-MaderosW2red]
MRSLVLDKVNFDKNGLVPVVVQDELTNQVLMLAFMNRESVLETMQLGQMVYYSRSRGARWHKGETSGNFQNVKSLWLDCDQDTILARVTPMGPACHNGTTSCFEEPK